MRTTLGTAVLLLTFLGCGEGVDLSALDQTGSTAAVKPLNKTHIVFYNVENLFDTKNDPRKNDDWFTPDADTKWDQKRYDHKLEQLAKAISWTGKELPALVGLAEVETEQCVKDLARAGELHEGNYGHSHFESPDERGIDVALLYRKDHFKVISEAPIEVKLDNDKTRDILHVHGKLDGEEMHIFVCHWSSRGEGVKKTEHRRVTAARAVRNEVDDILKDDPNMNILIMGDLNDYPTSRSVSQVLAAACNDKASDKDLVDLVCTAHKADRGSYNYKGDWGYIDHFIVSTSMLDTDGFIADEAKAFFDDRLLFRHPKFGKSPDRTYSGRKYHGGFSDHLPIVLQLMR